MYIRIPAHLASWSFTSFTVFYQRFALFPTILIINVSLGAIIIVTHTFSSNKISQSLRPEAISLPIQILASEINKISKKARIYFKAWIRNN
uniref:Uncharacterized protein n=1 Tax=Romanomermis culicivorax TaxID=13658 RepID=A0A915JB38_ROMCU